MAYPGSFTENGTENTTAALRGHNSHLLGHWNYSVQWQFLQWDDGTVDVISDIGEAVVKRPE